VQRLKKNATTGNTSAGSLGYEAELWYMDDGLRGSMDATEYNHVVLGLIFLKYISDAFEEQHAELEAYRAEGADREDPDEYRAKSIFCVPREARWPHLRAQVRQPTIGQLVYDAMAGVERDTPYLSVADDLLQLTSSRKAVEVGKEPSQAAGDPSLGLGWGRNPRDQKPAASLNPVRQRI